jgi:hypothetical protein
VTNFQSMKSAAEYRQLDDTILTLICSLFRLSLVDDPTPTTSAPGVAEKIPLMIL